MSAGVGAQRVAWGSSWCMPAILFEESDEFIVGNGEIADSVDAGHGAGCNQGVDNGFLGRLDSALEHRVDTLVRQLRDRRRLRLVHMVDLRGGGAESEH